MPTSSQSAGRQAGAQAGTQSRGPRARRTTQPANGPSRWFPQRKDFDSYQTWDTHYRAFQHIYELQDQVNALAVSVKASAQAASSAASGRSGQSGQSGQSVISPGNQTSASHILGIAVKAAIPVNGQTLKYVAKENQFVFS